jgi:FkbM family methyltransferase
MVELGSFWAYYSLWLKNAIPDARLVLVEPDVGNLEVGRHNLALNRVEASSIVQAAVGNRHDLRAPVTWESDGIPHITRHVTIDGLMRELELERIDLLSCDVQGAELAMLEGAVDALAEGRIRFLVISTHHHRISGSPLTHQQCCELLREVGAHFIAEHSVSESCSGDGLLVASTDRRDTDLHAQVTIVRARDTLFGELEWDLAEKYEEVRVSRGEAEAIRSEVAALTMSLSWRVTRPLRAARRMHRRLLRRLPTAAG